MGVDSDDEDLADYAALTKELRAPGFSESEEADETDDDRAPEPEKSLARINRILISSYGSKSAEQVAEETGLPVGEIAKRRQELFASIDVLDLAEKRTKLMLQLENMVDDLQSRLAQSSDRNAAGLANAARGSLATVLKELAAMEKASQVDIDAINAKRAGTLVHIVERSFDRTLGTLSERYPDVPQGEIEAEFQRHIKAVAKEYDSETPAN